MRTRTLLLACCLGLWLFAAGRLPAEEGWSIEGQAQSPDPNSPATAGLSTSPAKSAGWSTSRALAVEPLASAFTYQGQLLMNGAPVGGACDLQFGLWDALSGGTLVAATQTQASVQVQNGLFTLRLDFGPLAFNGGARWLEVAARCPAGSGAYEQLIPRQPLTAVPYALYAMNVPWGGLTDDQALELWVDNARAMRFAPSRLQPRFAACVRGRYT